MKRRISNKINKWVVCRRNIDYQPTIKNFFASRYWRALLERTAPFRYEKPFDGLSSIDYAFAVPCERFRELVAPTLRLQIYRDINDNVAFVVDSRFYDLDDLIKNGFVLPLLIM